MEFKISSLKDANPSWISVNNNPREFMSHFNKFVELFKINEDGTVESNKLIKNLSFLCLSECKHNILGFDQDGKYFIENISDPSKNNRIYFSPTFTGGLPTKGKPPKPSNFNELPSIQQSSYIWDRWIRYPPKMCFLTKNAKYLILIVDCINLNLKYESQIEIYRLSKVEYVDFEDDPIRFEANLVYLKRLGFSSWPDLSEELSFLCGCPTTISSDSSSKRHSCFYNISQTTDDKFVFKFVTDDGRLYSISIDENSNDTDNSVLNFSARLPYTNVETAIFTNTGSYLCLITKMYTLVILNLKDCPYDKMDNLKPIYKPQKLFLARDGYRQYEFVSISNDNRFALLKFRKEFTIRYNNLVNPCYAMFDLKTGNLVSLEINPKSIFYKNDYQTNKEYSTPTSRRLNLVNLTADGKACISTRVGDPGRDPGRDNKKYIHELSFFIDDGNAISSPIPILRNEK